MEIEIYETALGKKPFDDWFEDIADLKTRSKILTRLDRLSELGAFGDCKHLGNGIYELRIHYGAGFRIYYSKINNIIVLLLCGGSKNSQKRDIQKAKEFLEDYKNREKKHGKK